MSRRKSRERNQKPKGPEFGVIQPADEADPFGSFTSVDSAKLVEEKESILGEVVPKEDDNLADHKVTRSEKEPISIASFLSAFSFKNPEERAEEEAVIITDDSLTAEEDKASEKNSEEEEKTITTEVEKPEHSEKSEELGQESTEPENQAEEQEPEEKAGPKSEPMPEPEKVPEPDFEIEELKPEEAERIRQKEEPLAVRDVHDDSIIIELKGLTRRYGYGDATSYALKDFDLTIKRGEFIMIMGPSGCGKTTLLNIIGLLDRATSGEYTLNGEDVARISHRRQSRLRAKKIGFIFQDFNLINSLPLIENVALPLVYVGRSKTARLKTASDALKRFHLGEREYYYPSQLSGGQQQRAAIARAIVSDPEIILADEPTGNLDSRSSSIVMEELKQIHEEGNTIIMVTHNPSLTMYATRVIHMLDGQIDTDIKTVADHNLPQPVSSRRRRRRKFRGYRQKEENK